MEIKLNTQESEEYFYNALCNGLGYVESGYGLWLDYSEEDYEKARKVLGHEANGSMVAYEDVLLEMLRLGCTLTMIDQEGDKDRYEISLADVHERVSNAPARHILDMINENDDAETADVIIQQVFFNEIIFG